uniref:Uncharacterized protein n=1 Tax=Romanomermis culicivorax TaxID=13658 RepID=A0A915J4U3_ROMCU
MIAKSSRRKNLLNKFYGLLDGWFVLCAAYKGNAGNKFAYDQREGQQQIWHGKSLLGISLK